VDASVHPSEEFVFSNEDEFRMVSGADVVVGQGVENQSAGYEAPTGRGNHTLIKIPEEYIQTCKMSLWVSNRILTRRILTP